MVLQTELNARAKQPGQKASAPTLNICFRCASAEVLLVAVNLGRNPGRSVGSNPIDERKQVVSRPLLGDLSVYHAVYIDRIPPDVSS